MVSEKEIEKFRDHDRRGYILEDWQEISVLKDDILKKDKEIYRLREALKECARPFNGNFQDNSEALAAAVEEFQRRVNIACVALKEKE